MEYAQFLSGIKALKDEATQLFGREKLHEDRQFRKWRHELMDLISRISYQGFPINCQISARTFDLHASPDTPISKAERIAAYDRDLLDTINELDTLIKRHAEFGAPTPLSSQKPAVALDSQNAISKFQKHWFASFIALCAIVVAGTWAVAHQLFVVPRDFEIVRLKEALAQAQSNVGGSPALAVSEGKVLLSNIGVAVGNSITTPDGTCTVRVVSLLGGSASLDVAIDAEEPQLIKQAQIGRRTVVRGAKQTYYIDLHRERGDMVDLSVSSGRSAEQAPAADARKASRG